MGSRLAVRDSSGKYVAPKSGEFTSRDTSKSYSGTTVRQTSSGKIATVGSSREIVEEAKARANLEAETKREEIKKQRRAVTQQETQQILQDKNIRQTQLQRQYALLYQTPQITGDEKAEDIKRLAEETKTSEKKVALAVATQKDRREYAKAILKKQSEKEAPKYIIRQAQKILKEDPTAKRVTVKSSAGSYTFERGATFNLSPSTIEERKDPKAKLISTPTEARAYLETNPVAKKFLEAQARTEEVQAKQVSGSLKSTALIVGASALKSSAEIVKHPVKTAGRLAVYGIVGALTGGVGVVALGTAEVLTSPEKRGSIYYAPDKTKLALQLVGEAIPYAVVGGVAYGTFRVGSKAITKLKGTRVEQISVSYPTQKVHVGKTGVSHTTTVRTPTSKEIQLQRDYIGYDQYGFPAKASKGIGKEQLVTVSKIKGSVGLKGVKGSSVTVGKVTRGTIKSGKYDIFFKRSPAKLVSKVGGKTIKTEGFITELKYFKKGTTKLVKQTQSPFTKKPSKPEVTQTLKSHSIKGQKDLKTRTDTTLQRAESLDLKPSRFSLRSKEVDSVSLSQSKQTDVAGYYLLKQRVEGGKTTIITKKGQIVYSKDPTYKPNILRKEFDVSPGKPKTITEISTTIKNPSLKTFAKEDSRIVTKQTFEEKPRKLHKKAELRSPDILLKTKQDPRVMSKVRIKPSKPELSLVSGEVIQRAVLGSPKVKISPLILGKIETESRSEGIVRSKSIVNVENITRTDPLIDTDTIGDIDTITDTTTETKTQTRAKAKTEIVSEQIQLPKSKQSTTQIKTPITTTGRPPLTTPTFDIEKPTKKGIFSVEGRREGKFKEIAKAETIQEAFAKGSLLVDVTSMASFRIKPLGFEFDVGSRAKALLPETFRISKKEPGVFIEKREFRISTPGEKKEITEKGLFSLRSKTKKKGFSIF